MVVESADLHSEIRKAFHPQEPERFVQGDNLVGNLQKFRYGLKQAPRVWYRKLHVFLAENRLHKNANDPCFFTTKKQDNSLCKLVSVDDILIAGN